MHPAIWPQQICAENWGRYPFEGGGSRSPSHTVCPRPTCMLSFFLIYKTIWPQYTNVTDRTGQTDRTDRQRSGSTGRSVLQTDAQIPKMVAMASSRRCSVSGNIYLLSADHAYPVHNQLPSCYRSHSQLTDVLVLKW